MKEQDEIEDSEMELSVDPTKEDKDNVLGNRDIEALTSVLRGE